MPAGTILPRPEHRIELERLVDRMCEDGRKWQELRNVVLESSREKGDEQCRKVRLQL